MLGPITDPTNELHRTIKTVAAMLREKLVDRFIQPKGKGDQGSSDDCRNEPVENIPLLHN